MADISFPNLPESVRQQALAALGKAPPSPESETPQAAAKPVLNYMSNDSAAGLEPTYRQWLQARETMVKEWENNLPPKTSPEYATSRENLDGTIQMLKDDQLQAAQLVQSNRDVAKILGIEPLPVAVKDNETGMFSKNAGYVEKNDGSSKYVSVNQLDLNSYGADSNEVKGSLAHEYGHVDWSKKGLTGSRQQEELYSDAKVAETCDPAIINAYKKVLAEDNAGLPADQGSKNHPSLNDRNAVLDKTYNESCKVAPMATPAGEAGKTGPVPSMP